MKNMFLKYVMFFSLFPLFISCGGGGDDEVIPIDISADTTWQFEDVNYDGGVSSGGVSQDPNTGDFGVLVVTTDQDTSNDDYSGSALTFTYSVSGEGNYTIVTTSEFARISTEDNTAKVLSLACVVGSAKANATRYEALSGELINVGIDSDGKYHFTTDGIQLTRSIEIGTGVPGAPETASLKIDNAFDFFN